MLADMARPSKNDIRQSAQRFALEWRDDSYERGEAQTFWTDFLLVFGVARRRVNAAFERHVHRTSTGRAGFIDLLWPGMLLAEHKSRGASLDAAMNQALDYIDGLPDLDLPRLVVVSDFARIRVLDLEDPEKVEFEFPLEDFPREVDRFLNLAGYTSRRFENEDAVSIEAAELLGKVYDEIAATGYTGHQLRVFLVRILFLLFGDDSGLWPRNQFADLLLNRTRDDGSDLGMWLGRLFVVLDTPETNRTTALDEDLAAFPYVNGGLYEERIEPPDTTRSMWERLREACHFDWSQISPAIFGSIFQSVMDDAARRAIGAHYTSEQNIMKVIEPLFLDDLRSELEACGRSAQKLRRFHDRLGKLTFFDPACGCGNFLVIAYRELRRLERETLHRLHPGNVQLTALLGELRKVNVDQFFGIEIEEFPARIAETAMYLMDHLENETLGAAFGLNIVDLPLTATAKIHVGNALRMDWNDVVPASDCSFVYGNPPFVGQYLRTDEQTDDLKLVWGRQYNGYLDYVTGWYAKAIEYDTVHTVRFAFVSTNSISQGEPVQYLWSPLMTAGYRIDFAHRTFAWTSESRGSAHVHCVIVGFSFGGQATTKRLFDYPSVRADALEMIVGRINPYLADGPEIVVRSRERPFPDWAPTMSWGSKAVDGGCLIVTHADYSEACADPIALKYIRRFVGSKELIDNLDRWCLWLVGAEPADLRSSPFLRERLAGVRTFRRKSKKPQTKTLASFPGLFAENRQPHGRYLAIPQTSSEKRRWIPMAYLPHGTIASNALYTIDNEDLAIFGFLQSSMWMAWVRAVSGRLKSDYQVAPGPVYNTFPFPDPTDSQRSRIRATAKGVLDARAAYSSSTLADLYDPLSMPAELANAHHDLDRVIDSTFGKRSVLNSDTERLRILFERYQKLATGSQIPGIAQTQPRKRLGRLAQTS
jgi:hypothetical protein